MAKLVLTSGNNPATAGRTDLMAWTATYKITARDRGCTNNSVAFNVAYTDLSGNAGKLVTTTSDKSEILLDTERPVILNQTYVSSNGGSSSDSTFAGACE